VNLGVEVEHRTRHALVGIPRGHALNVADSVRACIAIVVDPIVAFWILDSALGIHTTRIVREIDQPVVVVVDTVVAGD
jgi:hypothetical protein